MMYYFKLIISAVIVKIYEVGLKIACELVGYNQKHTQHCHLGLKIFFENTRDSELPGFILHIKYMFEYESTLV